MILHPGILALVGGTGIALFMLLYAGGLGVKILRKWDFRSSSEEQLLLERKTSLISTLVSAVLGLEIFSLFLFIFTVDEIHPLLTGAMCATGSLNANPVGWQVLLVKIAVFFAASIWLMLNLLDNRAEDLPLVKRKFAFLLPLVPLVGAEFYLQITYFLGLHPEVITSCCGSLFSRSGSGIPADLAGMEPVPAMAVFYGGAALFIGSGLSCFLSKAPVFRYLLAMTASLFFPIALVAVVSFISLYIYELPTHHCPFDILQKNYGFIGYPLYLGLFCATLFGVFPGIFQPLKKVASLKAEILRIERRWIFLALFFTACFLVLATWPILFGKLRLTVYSFNS